MISDVDGWKGWSCPTWIRRPRLSKLQPFLGLTALRLFDRGQTETEITAAKEVHFRKFLLESGGETW